MMKVIRPPQHDAPACDADGILSDLREREEAARHDARAAYRELVAALARGEPAGGATSVSAILAEAGRKVADLEQDLETERTRVRLFAIAMRIPELEVARTRANVELHDAQADEDRVITAAEKRTHEARKRDTAASVDLGHAREGESRLTKTIGRELEARWVKLAELRRRAVSAGESEEAARLEREMAALLQEAPL